METGSSGGAPHPTPPFPVSRASVVAVEQRLAGVRTALDGRQAISIIHHTPSTVVDSKLGELVNHGEYTIFEPSLNRATRVVLNQPHRPLPLVYPPPWFRLGQWKQGYAQRTWLHIEDPPSLRSSADAMHSVQERPPSDPTHPDGTVPGGTTGVAPATRVPEPSKDSDPGPTPNSDPKPKPKSDPYQMANMRSSLALLADEAPAAPTATTRSEPASNQVLLRASSRSIHIPDGPETLPEVEPFLPEEEEGQDIAQDNTTGASEIPGVFGLSPDMDAAEEHDPTLKHITSIAMRLMRDRQEHNFSFPGQPEGQEGSIAPPFSGIRERLRGTARPWTILADDQVANSDSDSGGSDGSTDTVRPLRWAKLDSRVVHPSTRSREASPGCESHRSSGCSLTSMSWSYTSSAQRARQAPSRKTVSSMDWSFTSSARRALQNSSLTVSSMDWSETSSARARNRMNWTWETTSLAQRVKMSRLAQPAQSAHPAQPAQAAQSTRPSRQQICLYDREQLARQLDQLKPLLGSPSTRPEVQQVQGHASQQVQLPLQSYDPDTIQKLAWLAHLILQSRQDTQVGQAGQERQAQQSLPTPPRAQDRPRSRLQRVPSREQREEHTRPFQQAQQTPTREQDLPSQQPSRVQGPTRLSDENEGQSSFIPCTPPRDDDAGNTFADGSIGPWGDTATDEMIVLSLNNEVDLFREEYLAGLPEPVYRAMGYTGGA